VPSDNPSSAPVFRYVDHGAASAERLDVAGGNGAQPLKLGATQFFVQFIEFVFIRLRLVIKFRQQRSC